MAALHTQHDTASLVTRAGGDLSTWLNAGVGPTEVAERVGNTVETLLRTYAKCLYGRQTVANDRIDKFLGDYE